MPGITYSSISADFFSELDQLLFLYANLNNKDEFINHYNIRLSRRFLNITSNSIETERAVIAKIRDL